MKKNIKHTIVSLAIILFTFLSIDAISQGPPPPPGGGSNTGNNQTGGGAPIGSGLLILLGLGAAYGGRKLYKLRKENLEE